MRRADPRMRDLARRLITLEATRSRSPSTTPPTAFLACEKLRPSLATLLGGVGFSALLSRALVLATTEVKWLGVVHVNVGGTLEGFAEPQARTSPAESARGGVVLLAQLLELLATFIGEALTVRLVREVWPELDADDAEFGKGSRK
jgi:hypothetical protein